MSSFGGSGGSRTSTGTKVCLNIYDLSPANDVLYPLGLGMHHSGVEIMGSEYSFASGAGIFSSAPKVVPGGAKFREQLDIGIFDGGMKELNFIISELRDTFGPDDYNLIRRNCNHFSNALCWRLLKRTIPGYVNRLADIGVCCSCLLPKKMLENAPVGGTSDATSSSSTSSFLVKAPPGRTVLTSQSTTKTVSFHGTGIKLGGSSLPSTSSTHSSSSDNNNNHEQTSLLARFSLGSLSSASATGGGTSTNNRQDDLTDRREKARKAALARIEKQQPDQLNDSDKSQ